MGARSTCRFQSPVDTLDPLAVPFSDYAEVHGNVFETLMLEEDARIVPCLVDVFETWHGGA